jgi:hypothetical protein
MGRALMGTGYAAGDRKALEAAQQALCSPLLEDAQIEGATGILINITGGPELTLTEINEAATLIQEAAHEDANIIFGSVIDANMEDQVRITVIATGFERNQARRADRSQRGAGHPRPQQQPTSMAQHRPSAYDHTLMMRAPTPQREAMFAEAVAAPRSETIEMSAAPPQYPETMPDSPFSADSAYAQPPQAAVATVAAPQQGSLLFDNETSEADRGVRPRRGAPDSVPPLHPSLARIPDDHEMDIPTFLRRQPQSRDVQ